ncbi:hypothetical protein [Actinotalea solisilvae]|uniref:hypothetical protein n=1 Tax=Actinotalea solisilvae TaxID=2072922 RepID=UPI0018F1769E|nr:hypothetical protein [Actinotalea solisilvae]
MASSSSPTGPTGPTGRGGSAGPGGPDRPSGPVADPTPTPWWRRPVVWVVAAVLVLAGVVAAVAASRSGSDPAPSPSASASASADASPSPDATPEPSASSEPSAEPTEGDEPPPDAAPGELRPTAPPVALDEPAVPAPQVTATLSRIEAVEGVANLPGEVGGPSLRVTVAIDNATDAPLDLTTAVVNLYVGPDRAPAITLLEPGHEEFPVSVDPGQQATGVFVFLVPVEQRDLVTVELDLSTEADVVLFEGAAPR